MKTNKKTVRLKRQWPVLAASVCSGMALLALAPQASAQTSEALMDALVRKGILTEQEAEDIKADVAKENRQYNKLTLGGKTVTGLNLYGDFRGRYEAFMADDPSPKFEDRQRFRYRLRLGLVYQMTDKFEVGLRLTSSEPTGTVGGDPISGNTTFQDNASKKFIYVDQAYGKWSPDFGPNWINSVIIGKMENPFVFSDLVFDGDYTPEGGALQTGYIFNNQHTARVIGGAFMLDEIGSAHTDPYMYGGQVRFDSVWTPKVATSFGGAVMSIVHNENLINTAVPNINRGNSRDADLSPTYNFNPFITDASFTYTFDRFPFYPGAFPVKVGGDYMINPAAPSSADNHAYSAGVTLGKAGKKGAWEAGYTWKWLGANSWWEELVDSDFGAFYGGVLPNSSTSAGYGSGTNVKGHVFRLSYSPYDSITLSAKMILTKLINEVGTGSSEMTRLQLDANWKF